MFRDADAFVWITVLSDIGKEAVPTNEAFKFNAEIICGKASGSY